MRKIIVLEHISIDGVIQAPGGPDEDTGGGFAYGGWIAPYSDEVLGEALKSRMQMEFDLLLGRKTYEIWAPYWPLHADGWLGASKAVKYVASNTITTGEWQPSVFLSGDIADQVAKIKQQPGPDLHVWGSANLIQTLMNHDLVDLFWLMIYPLTLGEGKRLFAGGSAPKAFKLAESTATPNGVLIMHYERAS